MSLKPFAIFVKEGSKSNIKIIQDGVSWKALFFNVFWLFAKCQWLLLILFCFYHALVMFLYTRGLDLSFCALLYGISAIYLWVYGKKWEMRGLTKKGYKKIRMLMGTSVDDIELYVSRSGLVLH